MRVLQMMPAVADITFQAQQRDVIPSRCAFKHINMPHHGLCMLAYDSRVLPSSISGKR